MSYDLANKYADFKVPAEVKQMVLGNNLSLSASKMAIFADTEKLSNEDIEYYAALKPERMKDEDFEDYKNRRKFQKELYRRRTLVYDYSNI